MSSPVESIKERLGVAEVIGSYVTLQKAGASLKARCPFHNERTPSFFVSPERGTYYCFGCGAKGDIFNFVQAFEGLDFPGALKLLASRAGVELVPEDPRAADERARTYRVLETATLFYQQQLVSNEGARSYLASRGLSEETISAWRLGYAPDEWRSVLTYLRGKGFHDADISRAGLVKTEKGSTYDRFRNRIMFPFFDTAGRVVAFSGRILGTESKEIAKYLNSPETAVFSKSHLLYGLDRAKSAIHKLDYAILVEGQMDLLMCHQAGFSNTTASSGTAFTTEQLRLLKRLSNRVLFVYDADEAGVKAALRSATIALAEGMEVKVVALPHGTDPAELIKHDRDAWVSRLKASTHVVHFYLERLLEEFREARSRARAIAERLLPLIAVVPSALERDALLQQVSERTGIRESALRDDLSRVPKQVASAEPTAKTDASKKALGGKSATQLLFGLLFWKQQSAQAPVDSERLTEQLKTITGEAHFKDLLVALEPSAQTAAFEAEHYIANTEIGEVIDELLATFEVEHISENMEIALQKLAQAENAKPRDGTLIEKILAECRDLQGRLEQVRLARQDLR